MTDIPTTAPALHPRRPAIAALLSFGLPGLGQLYNGEVNRALWLFLLFVLVGSPGVSVAALYVPSALMLPLVLICVALEFALWFGAAIHAWRGARRLAVYTRRDWQVSGLYALLLLSGIFLIQLPLGQDMKTHMVQSFSIPSQSMLPGILPGDILFADKRYNCPDCKTAAARGDIGIFVYPNNRTQNYIKRVIGLPGDHVTIKGHDVVVNGTSLTEVQKVDGDRLVVTEHSGERRWTAQWKADSAPAAVDLVVPAGQVFMLGDNRDGSSDSRQFGAVPLADLVGKARQIWFSHGEGGVRWGRLGMVVQ